MMIKQTKLSYAFFLLLAGLTATGCAKEETGPSEQEKMAKRLQSGIWKLQTLTIDEVDETTLYPGMTLTFGAFTYSSTGGEPVWPATGAWMFTSTDAKSFTRDDQVVVTIRESTSSTLVLELYWDSTTIGSGRPLSIGGEHVFYFVK